MLWYLASARDSSVREGRVSSRSENPSAYRSKAEFMSYWREGEGRRGGGGEGGGEGRREGREGEGVGEVGETVRKQKPLDTASFTQYTVLPSTQWSAITFAGGSVIRGMWPPPTHTHTSHTVYLYMISYVSECVRACKRANENHTSKH